MTTKEEYRDAAGLAKTRLEEARRVLNRQVNAGMRIGEPDEDRPSFDAGIQLDVTLRAVELALMCVDRLDDLVKP